ncbi:choloylglycine hydrolase family protein [Acuticoccus sp. MNP-M23]|uniref:choloylglycine hydrolase family protein n=1 Tax=Acuticoccus sp. MNP-M23 TaxID=3072793 RepID=UPI002814D590|nr:choloylglycine hydrolase family protein [Acuticoccus sp. MNP-M23]WMS41153.1 choloylglycine hydrolase family protein [Acuticoccus sp. MNP-M23]
MRSALLAAFAIMSFTPAALGCTAVNIVATDGTVVAARSMEWALPMEWTAVTIPVGNKYDMTAPEGSGLKPVAMETSHAIFGIKTALVPGNFLVDAQNDAGLTFSANFLPGFTQYQDVAADDKGYVGLPDFGVWSLGQFGSVAELQAALPDVKVWYSGEKIQGVVPDVHFVFTDSTGDSIVVEFVGGEQQISKNVSRVLTNAPTYDWHLNNLRNYLDLSPDGDGAVEIGGTNVTALGQGGGLRGVPADYTPPSRFVKAAYLTHFAYDPKDAAEAISLGNHILNTVDIPEGVVRSQEDGKTVADYTQWVVMKDLNNNTLTIADYDNRANALTIDLKALFKSGEAVDTLVTDLPFPGRTAVTTLN